MNRATTRSVPSNTSASSPVMSRLSSETLSTPCGSLRTTSSTWSSWYQRSTRRSLAAYAGGVQCQVWLVGGRPDRRAPLLVGQRQLDRAGVGHRREALADLGLAARRCLVKVCDRVIVASVPSPYLPRTAAGSSV